MNLRIHNPYQLCGKMILELSIGCVSPVCKAISEKLGAKTVFEIQQNGPIWVGQEKETSLYKVFIFRNKKKSRDGAEERDGDDDDEGRSERETIMCLENLYFLRALESTVTLPSQRKAIFSDLLSRDVALFLGPFSIFLCCKQNPN